VSRSRRAATDSRGAHVLVADDDPALRDLLLDLLVGEGLRVTTAGNGDEVLTAVADHAPDLVLLDVRMPRLEPDHFACAWRANPLAKRVPVVLVSAWHEIPESLRALSGVAPIAKPFDLTEILDVIARHCPSTPNARRAATGLARRRSARELGTPRRAPGWPAGRARSAGGTPPR